MTRPLAATAGPATMPVPRSPRTPAVTAPAALAPPPPAPITSENPAAAVTGTVRGGTVVLDDAAALPEGARVNVAAAPMAAETNLYPDESAEDAAWREATLAETGRLRRSPGDASDGRD